MGANRRIALSMTIGLLVFGTAALGQTPTPVDFEKEVQPIFTASCAVAGCHTGTTASAGMRLDAGFAYANLLNPPPPTGPRVIPKDPAKSLLVNGMVDLDDFFIFAEDFGKSA